MSSFLKLLRRQSKQHASAMSAAVGVGCCYYRQLSHLVSCRSRTTGNLGNSATTGVVRALWGADASKGPDGRYAVAVSINAHANACMPSTPTASLALAGTVAGSEKRPRCRKGRASTMKVDGGDKIPS